MSEEILKYIRKHDYIYYFLRENSSYYKEIYRNNNFVYKLKSIAKEYYKIRFIDKMEKLSSKMEIINSFMDVFK